MNPAKNYPARFWQREADQDCIVCGLCPRLCKIKDGQRGFCFVRQNIAGQLVLTTYGRTSGFCVDPIEKKPLYHFYPGTSVLSFGTTGCNLGCKFCQNWDISRSRDFDRLSEQAEPQAIAQAAKKLGCKSVAFTYNEPVIFAEFAIDVANACHEQGVKTVAVTSGYVQGEARREFFAAMDAANVDLKAFTESFYHRLCQATLQPVLDVLIYIKKETKVWLEITTLLIPGENDSPEEVDALTKWVVNELGADVPLHFSAFHPDFRMMNYPPTTIETLAMARNMARKNGLHHVYTGNVVDPVGANTYCGQCGQTVVKREGYELSGYHLRDGRECPSCGAVCAGHFEKTPGHWGSRRLPVHLP